MPGSLGLADCVCCGTPRVRRSGTFFCVDKSVTAVVIQGLAEHKDTLGAPLCPCRHYDDKEAEAAQGYWNCPCVPMRERKVRHARASMCMDAWMRAWMAWCASNVYAWHRHRDQQGAATRTAKHTHRTIHARAHTRFAGARRTHVALSAPRFHTCVCGRLTNTPCTY